MKIEWNKVTWYSIALTVVILVGTLVIGIYFIQQYGQVMDDISYYRQLGAFPVRTPIIQNSSANGSAKFSKERIAQFVGFPDSECPSTKFGISIVDRKMLFINRDQSCQSPGKILYLDAFTNLANIPALGNPSEDTFEIPPELKNVINGFKVICAFPSEIFDTPYLEIKPISGNCIDIQYERLFSTIMANSEKRDLGLGPSHTVEQYSPEEIAQLQMVNQEEGGDNRRNVDLWEINRAIKTYLDQDNGFFGCEAGEVYESSKGYDPIDGTGWLPVDFTKISGASPFKQLPFDIQTLSDPTSHFLFACDPDKKHYELDMKPLIKHEWALEDGGNNPDLYELGNNLELLN